jgi:alpha-glucosidase
VAESQRALAVDAQEADADSLLHHYRHLLHWRRGQPALIHGDMQLLPRHDQVLAHVREHAGQRVLCAFNLSERAASFELPAGLPAAIAIDGSGLRGAHVQGAQIRFEPWGGVFCRLN